tara:strand:- start:5358 stop:5954 length:597 start_codon:yes stop_codon:yes gene_type:complete
VNNMKAVKTNKEKSFIDGLGDYFNNRGNEKIRILEGFEKNIQHDVVFLDKLKDYAKALHFRLEKISLVGKQQNDVEFAKLDIDLFKTAEEISKVEQIVYDKYIYFEKNLKPRMQEEFGLAEAEFESTDKEAKKIIKEWEKVSDKLGDNPLVEKIKKEYATFEDNNSDIKNIEDKNALYKGLKRLVAVWNKDTTKGRGK